MFENKKKFALWVYPDTLEKIENIYREDDCESKSEFIEKAINFISDTSLPRIRKTICRASSPPPSKQSWTAATPDRTE